MNHPVLFTEAAQSELQNAFDWYENRQAGLGRQFADELNTIMRRIAAHPLQFPIARKDVRRASVRRFPYTIFFRLLPDRIQVIACFHTSRDPIQWHRRT